MQNNNTLITRPILCPLVAVMCQSLYVSGVHIWDVAFSCALKFNKYVDGFRL